MRMLLTMTPTIVLAIYAQLIVKWRVSMLFSKMNDGTYYSVRIFRYLTDPYILSSYLAAVAASVTWMLVAERFSISLAFPIYVGLTVAAVALGGCVLLDETMTVSRIVAVALILAGVAIGALS